MPDICVYSPSMSDINAAISAAGADGVVRFVPGTVYPVSGLVAAPGNQTWIARGARFQFSDGNSILSIPATSSLKMVGGVLDGMGATMPVGIDQIGAFDWEGGLLTNVAGWGVGGLNGALNLHRVRLEKTKYAAVLWQSKIAGSLAPQIRSCQIDRRVGYVSSGGILINGGSGVLSCVRSVVHDCDIWLPDDLTYDNVAVEMNYADTSQMTNNRLQGSRIGFSMQTCWGSQQQGNTSKATTNYAHEVVNCEWTSVVGNVATASSGSLYGVTMSGTSRGNRISNNLMKMFSVPVKDVSSPVAGYPSTIADNS